MRTLIIPCCGRSTLDGQIKCIAEFPNGLLLIRRCIEGMDLEGFDRIIATILQEDEEKHQISEKIRESWKDTGEIELCILDNQTSGPAETVYLTISRMKIIGAIVIKDVDNYVLVPKIDCLDFVVGMNVFQSEKNVRDIIKKSFLIINEQKRIIDIFEKQLKSDIMCLGLYGIKNAELFQNAYEALCDLDYNINKMYISHVISYLIGHEKAVFRYIEASDYESYGSNIEWQEFKNRYAIYFIRFDMLYKQGEWNQAVIEGVKQLVNQGAKLIITTRLQDNYKKEIAKYLKNKAIPYKEIICTCSEPIQIVLKDENQLFTKLIPEEES